LAKPLSASGSVGGIKTLRMPQIAHLKEISRGGVNPASGSIPAGSRITFVRKPSAGKRR